MDSGEILPSNKSPNVYEEGVGLSLCEDPNNYLAEVEAVIEKSLELLDAQVPTPPALLPDKQDIGKKRAYTYPQSEDGIKQSRIVDSFDGVPCTIMHDEVDVPEVALFISFYISLLSFFFRKKM